MTSFGTTLFHWLCRCRLPSVALNQFLTCGMFIILRDVSNKMEGGEESHGTQIQSILLQLRSMCQHNPTRDRYIRLNHITCGMFIVLRDVFDKMHGGEESHGTQIQSILLQLRSMCQHNPTRDRYINTRNSDRFVGTNTIFNIFNATVIHIDIHFFHQQ